MKIKYTITGLDCPNCAAKLAANISAGDGIDGAKINFLTEKLTIESSMKEEDVFELVKREAKAFSKDIKVEK